MTCNQFPTATTVEVPEIPVQPNLMLSPSTTAVVVVDMQKDFVDDGGSLHVEAARATVPQIAALLQRGRDAGVMVLYTQDTHGEEDREFAIWPVHCVEGTRGWEIVDELSPHPGDLVVQKHRYDGFYGTALDHHLRHEASIDHLIIVGTVANICVGQTAASAGLRWYNVVTAADGISALTAFDQIAALRQITSLYNGQVVASVDDLAFSDDR